MNESKELTNQYRIEHWAATIQECISSGKLVNNWCVENNISRDQYYYWLRKVKLATGKAMSKRIKATEQLKIVEQPKVVPLIPITTECISNNNESEAAIVIKSNGLVLEIQNIASEAVIERTLKVLKKL
jgi:hypothetical protein